MLLTSLALQNWRNFRDVEVSFSPVSYIIGPNAAGKSNLLDAIRFLRDIARTSGGGLQKAVDARGGIAKVRCLHARKQTDVRIELTLREAETDTVWVYRIEFNKAGKKGDTVAITREWVTRNGLVLLSRPDQADRKDPKLLEETHLEQSRANAKFRDISDFLNSVTYLHLVPQLLKFDRQFGGRRLEEDPFGQAFLERIAMCSPKIRTGRLNRINRALQKAIPKFDELQFIKDKITNENHLQARYIHHRPLGAWQREDDFSDGTLRLIGLLWSLLEGETLLLLEEPELSLNDAIVRGIPRMIHQVLAKQRDRRQVIVSTHSEALLDNTSIHHSEIVRLEPGDEGTVVSSPTNTEIRMMESGVSPANVLQNSKMKSDSLTPSLFDE
jgi:predicted ATPase